MTDYPQNNPHGPTDEQKDDFWFGERITIPVGHSAYEKELELAGIENPPIYQSPELLHMLSLLDELRTRMAHMEQLIDQYIAANKETDHV